jgi:hypothetical protein
LQHLALSLGEQVSTPSTEVLNHLYLSGITFFTVGYGDLTPKTPWAKIVAVVEAGTGLAFLGTVIGHLPVLYQLFSRREIQVIVLDPRAGSPPTATALLTRHAHGESTARLQVLLHEWESWFALVLESHLSYLRTHCKLKRCCWNSYARRPGKEAVAVNDSTDSLSGGIFSVRITQSRT